MRLRLGLGKDGDVSIFSDLITAYGAIVGHVTTWHDDTFPQTVDLADNIVHYASKAKVYYGALNDPISALINNPDDATAKKLIKGITDNLAKDANDYASKATSVQAKITQFANDTASDKSTLDTLVPAYQKKYGSTSQEVIDLNKEIEAQRLILKSANDEYDHDVVVAATTPTYAWIFPAGTIAAAVVAGVYGDKAVKALDRARAAQEKINTLAEAIARDANLMVSLTSASGQLNDIDSQINSALPVIQKIEGIWKAIGADLTNIGNIVINDIQKAIPILKNLGVTQAIEAWQQVGVEANNYRVNAFITVSDDPSSDSLENAGTVAAAVVRSRKAA
jgi:hypothetical protein